MMGVLHQRSARSRGRVHTPLARTVAPAVGSDLISGKLPDLRGSVVTVEHTVGDVFEHFGGTVTEEHHTGPT